MTWYMDDNTSIDGVYYCGVWLAWEAKNVLSLSRERVDNFAHHDRKSVLLF